MLIHDLFKKTDYAWYQDLFSKKEKKSLSNEEIDEIINKSMTCAKEVYERFKVDLKLIGIEKMIEKYSSKVLFNDLNKSNRIIAMYDNNERLLIIFNHSITELHEQIKKKKLDKYLDKETLKRLILAHELYHIIEMNADDIYTYSEIYEYKILGFNRKRRLVVASEIGAFHFSKLVNEIEFSPCLVNSLYI